MTKILLVKDTKFVKSTKTNKQRRDSGAITLPPIGDVFLYIETSSNNHGSNVFYSLERTDIVQSSNIAFFHNRFSNLTNKILKVLSRFRIQLFLEDNTWSTRYNIPKIRYSDSSSQWTKLSSNFTW